MLKKIKTKSGFECEVDSEVMDDADILDLLVEADDGNELSMFKAFKLFIGKEQYKKAKDFIRDENGKAKASALYTLLLEIFTSIGDEGKNS